MKEILPQKEKDLYEFLAFQRYQFFAFLPGARARDRRRADRATQDALRVAVGSRGAASGGGQCDRADSGGEVESMTRILKFGRQRVVLCRSKKIRTELYHHLSRENADLIIGVASFQFGVLLRFPELFSHAILWMKWNWLGMRISDSYDSCRCAWKEWRAQ